MTPDGKAEIWDWPLPPEPYLPGRNARPGDDDDVHRIARAAPDPTEPDMWAQNEAWLAGVRLYSAGFFWEAHEVWEPVWMNARPNSRERLLVQGVIQVANAALKQKMGRIPAAARLAGLSANLIAESSRPCIMLMGVDVAALSLAIAQYCECLGCDHDAAKPPQIGPIDFG